LLWKYDFHDSDSLPAVTTDTGQMGKRLDARVVVETAKYSTEQINVLVDLRWRK